MSSDIRWYKRLYRLMMIMSPDRAAGVRVSLPDRRKNETQRDNKPLSRHIASGDRACHFGVMGGLGAKSHLYPDEWLSMFFLTLIFLLVCMFELEYERKQKGISANTQTTFIRLSVTYTVSGGLIYAISYLPEFYRPVMIPVILLTAVSNSMVAVSFGLFFDLVLALTVGGSFYALAAYMMLTMLAAVLAQALKEKNTVWVYPF